MVFNWVILVTSGQYILYTSNFSVRATNLDIIQYIRNRKLWH